MTNVYCVERRSSGNGYGVCAAGDSPLASALPHDKLTAGEAEFLAAHMNHAFQCGVATGDKQRRDAICDALGLV